MPLSIVTRRARGHIDYWCYLRCRQAAGQRACTGRRPQLFCQPYRLPSPLLRSMHFSKLKEKCYFSFILFLHFIIFSVCLIFLSVSISHYLSIIFPATCRSFHYHEAQRYREMTIESDFADISSSHHWGKDLIMLYPITIRRYDDIARSILRYRMRWRVGRVITSSLPLCSVIEERTVLIFRCLWRFRYGLMDIFVVSIRHEVYLLLLPLVMNATQHTFTAGHVYQSVSCFISPGR